MQEQAGSCKAAYASRGPEIGRKPAWMLGLLGFCPNIHLFSKVSKPEL